MNTYKITLLAFLAAIAIVGRNLLVFLPGVQPVTSIIIITGIILGIIPALIMAVLITFISNMTLGMGIWSIAQVVSWGIIGTTSAVLGKAFKNLPIYLIIMFAIFSGYFYGFVISLMTYQVTGLFWPYYLSGLPHDTNHAIGNGIFMLFFYPLIAYLLKRYSKEHF